MVASVTLYKMENLGCVNIICKYLKANNILVLLNWNLLRVVWFSVFITASWKISITYYCVNYKWLQV